MLRLLRLIFMGYWHDKEHHHCRLETVEELIKNSVRMGDRVTSKVYVNRCKDCGAMSHYEVKA